MSITTPTAISTARTAATPTARSAATVGTHRRPSRLVRPGVIAGFVAAAATSLVAAAAGAAGADLVIAGETVPASGFAVLTIVGALIGIALATALSHWADHPRATFVRTTLGLTALSIVPDVLVDAGSATKILLATTHVVAAAIIIPTLATRLAD